MFGHVGHVISVLVDILSTLFLELVFDNMYMQFLCETDDSFDTICLFIWKSLPGEPFHYTHSWTLIVCINCNNRYSGDFMEHSIPSCVL